MVSCGGWMRKLIRKKTFTEEDLDKSELKRCLSIWELIGMGIASTLGAGVYMTSGQISRESAGPAVVLSYFIAAIAAALAGVCYAEFAARVPRAGSAYVYSYVTVGEFMAFNIGWNILLEYLIGVAAVARSLSAYVDYLTGYAMQTFFQNYMPISSPGLAAYPDFLALSIVLVATVIVALGVKESVTVNILLSCINCVVLVIIIICGFIKADFHNWQLSGDELPASGAGNGGFAPFGISGVLEGAAICFFAYVGFDFLATMGEEAEDSRWAIPVSMGATLVIITVLHCLVATVLPLMVPYFAIDVQAPLVFAFDYVGWWDFRYVITLGALCGMTSSVVAPLFPMARVVYAMSSDGLVFRSLSAISPRFRTPVWGTLLSGAIAGLLTLLFEMTELIHMMSIGTLMAFLLVAVCVLILRYKNDDAPEGSVSGLDVTSAAFRLRHLVCPSSATPTQGSSRIANVFITVMCACQLVWAVLVVRGLDLLLGLNAGVTLAFCTLSVIIIVCLFIIARQPQNPKTLRFKVPMVPVLPAASCMINVFLMMKLKTVTLLRFVICMFTGLCIYLFYGIRHSSLNTPSEERKPLRSSEARNTSPSTRQQTDVTQQAVH